ncbi:nitronate monooxygenase, partial [Streptomyces sp. AK02-04a]|uniref:nitronate monooxygenase n=1 Tax=Streptomyces sp. AK02-04a TaxID=3028649 RepID=UPI0029B8B1C5
MRSRGRGLPSRRACGPPGRGAPGVLGRGGHGGGHTGEVATTVLLPQVVDAVDIPVVAAGGFHD